MIWLFHYSYPNGLETPGGFYAKANLYAGVDAQTGQVLGVSVTGGYQGGGNPVLVKAPKDTHVVP